MAVQPSRAVLIQKKTCDSLKIILTSGSPLKSETPNKVADQGSIAAKFWNIQSKTSLVEEVANESQYDSKEGSSVDPMKNSIKLIQIQESPMNSFGEESQS